MNGERLARLYSTSQPVRLRWAKGVISSIEPARDAPETDLWLAPSLIDLQINGYAGVDFQQDCLTEAELLRAVKGLRAAGCGKFLLTLITDDWKKMLGRVHRLRDLRNRAPEIRAAIAGWHLEGPFLSAEAGYCGAHNPECMIDPTAEHIQQVREVAQADPVLLTLAPERVGAIEAIRLAKSLGIKVSLGHTNASADVLRRAVEAGATGFTHLGNACPQGLDRHDNILWRVFDTPGLTVSLICDTIHVSPPLFRLAHRVLGSESLYYTTDAMAAAGAEPGRYRIGGVEVEVGPDQVVRQPGKSNYAGSALRPLDGVFRAAEMLGDGWQKVWDGLSERPAAFMGWSHGLRPGQPADFCLVRPSDNHRTAEVQTFVAGSTERGPA